MSLLLKAIQFATKVHEGQTRKGKKTPYITHPLGVALLLSQNGAKETVVIAGILHDTIEDCIPYGSITKELLAKEFTPQIAELVDQVTEQDKTLPWKIRKQRARDHIPQMPKDAVFLKSADVLYNQTDKLEDFRLHGLDMFRHYSSGKEEQFTHTQTVIENLEKAWPENPLIAPLKQTFAELKKQVR